MLVCVAGKNQIAVDLLEVLVERMTASALCVVPNRTDDGSDGWQPSLRSYAAAQGVPEVELGDLGDRADLVFLSLEFDRIIRPSAFATTRLFNIHFSLLPAYKGMYTSCWPILNGETESGVTLHFIDPGIDTGDIIAQSAFPIGPDDTVRDLYLKYLHHGTELVLANLDALLDPTREVVRVPQPVQGSSYYSKASIDYDSFQIDVKKTAWQVHNQIRAFVFREYQMPELHGRTVKSSRPLESRSSERPGTIVAETPFSLTVATVDYDLEVHLDLLPEVMRCCRERDATGLAALLSGDTIDLDEWDENGETPLMIAVEKGDPQITSLLLDRGADPARCDWKGDPPAARARLHSDRSVRDALLKVLEQHSESLPGSPDPR